MNFFSACIGHEEILKQLGQHACGNMLVETRSTVVKDCFNRADVLRSFHLCIESTRIALKKLPEEVTQQKNVEICICFVKLPMSQRGRRLTLD
jgi:hypothetical protein